MNRSPSGGCRLATSGGGSRSPDRAHTGKPTGSSIRSVAPTPWPLAPRRSCASGGTPLVRATSHETMVFPGWCLRHVGTRRRGISGVSAEEQHPRCRQDERAGHCGRRHRTSRGACVGLKSATITRSGGPSKLCLLSLCAIAAFRVERCIVVVESTMTEGQPGLGEVLTRQPCARRIVKRRDPLASMRIAVDRDPCRAVGIADTSSRYCPTPAV